MNNIKAVVFDFDGTLTHKNENMWRNIYETIGYSTDKTSSYRKSYVDFINGKIDYDYWVKINENDFINGGLTKEVFYKIASEANLIAGAEETIKKLHSNGIKLYVLSGNFVESIKHTLGHLADYFEEISANKIEFKDDGNFLRLTATKYDYDKKPDFLIKISKELDIRPSEICFIGNGKNDVFAYRSGAQTICINPENNCHETKDAWTHVIENCTNLSEILKFIK